MGLRFARPACSAADSAPAAAAPPQGVIALAKRILIAEDDTALRRTLRAALCVQGYVVSEARDGAELLERVTDLVLAPPTQRPCQLVISDQQLPGWSGLEVLAGLRAFKPRVPFVLLTDFGGPAFDARARRAGARAVLDKPLRIGELLQLVHELIGPARG